MWNLSQKFHALRSPTRSTVRRRGGAGCSGTLVPIRCEVGATDAIISFYEKCFPAHPPLRPRRPFQWMFHSWTALSVSHLGPVVAAASWVADFTLENAAQLVWVRIRKTKFYVGNTVN